MRIDAEHPNNLHKNYAIRNTMDWFHFSTYLAGDPLKVDVKWSRNLDEALIFTTKDRARLVTEQIGVGYVVAVYTEKL